ncbi:MULTISPECIES: dicarboxylate/amino acid:cation symporter [Pseudoalteromonas]|uniref:dicarboxylate/amino acid:cation symporter n=1 Tax=Pseudoalteromonas TaxID=53246 RepID=UPI0015FBC631|nr:MULTISPECIES: dicarboxylate/amino acid:cation symporter [unclassified Pseudoalteromonas]MBB1278534.1 dicarboxylate/amino acid:cation symporter [Pseudoalteromonas sp. SR43-3]MBB1282369.1 dicarboxylate/amino acid:cation symporter [Pseudoalteromonas sp. SR41-1]MBB1307106.1 dicarboxylate/amino acid:cation symporter [Pseudoalteromonas sp. SR43-5]MBB1347779.1 dicarboxylate/amino acid:cation symporter [Pseudoalteromonas sp. SG45-2]MBB1352046.1 dicarboxylate/amino acid:cation symporter [Pseudoalter|tara:strand:+ start:301 stop:1452 length:1152 start_codon:yes stop_codon:yes gene_type:complete
MKLILKLIAGIVAGILVGLYVPITGVELLFTVKELIGQIISFTIPLIILFFIASGIAGLPKGSGHLLGKTVGFAYSSTIIAGTLAFLLVSAVIPFLSGGITFEAEVATEIGSFIDLEIPPLMGVMTALVTAFVFGIGMSQLELDTLKKVSDQGRDVIDGLLSKVIIPALPFYIAGVFAEMTVAGTVVDTLRTFGVVLIAALVMHWLWLSVLYIATGVLLKRNPIELVKNMLPAYFTALGTMSSAATIPVSLQSSKANNVKEDVANFTVPLCATIHLSGSTITIVTCAMAVMFLSPSMEVPSLMGMLPFIMMLGVVMIAAPGAPGGAVMSALGLLTSMLGFNEGAVALMIALYLAQDSFGTACNVTGDGIIALWVDRFSEKSSS